VITRTSILQNMVLAGRCTPTEYRIDPQSKRHQFWAGRDSVGLATWAASGLRRNGERC